MKNRFNNTLNTGKKRSGIFALLALILCTALAGGLTACKADTGNNSVDNPDNKNSEKQIGYIYNFNTTNNGFEFDEIEWVTLDDAERIKELNLSSDEDFPNGFYINNPASDTKVYTVTNEAEYKIIDWNNNGESSLVDLNGFVTHLKVYKDYSPPFWIVVDNNEVTSIVEQYVP